MSDLKQILDQSERNMIAMYSGQATDVCADLETVMRRTANNMEYLYLAEVDIYSDLDTIAERYMTQGFSEPLAYEIAYAKIESENEK